MFDKPEFTERTVPAAVEARPPTRGQYVRETYPLPSGWEYYRWEAKGEGEGKYVLVTGAVCTALYERGPKKGRKNWSKMDKATNMTFPVPEKAYREWLAKWQAETGHCPECFGSGRAWAGWNCNTGTHYRSCGDCSGTGIPPVQKAA